jgi:hypothetical protein
MGLKFRRPAGPTLPAKNVGQNTAPHEEMTVRIRGVLLTMAALLVLAAATGSQPSGLPPVPEGLSAQQTSTLTKERARVVAEGERLQKLVEDHHAKCAHIGLPLPSGQTPGPQDEALKQQCESDQAAIAKQVKQYAADAAAYRKAVDTALVGSAAANKAYAARVVLKGGVSLGSSGQERALTSSRVVQLTSGEHVTTAPHARAAFQFPDGSEFIVGPETDLLLVAMVNGPQASQRRDLRLTKGTLRWVSSGSATGGAGNASVALGSGIVRLGVSDVQFSVSNDSSGYVAVFKGNARLEQTKNRSTVDLKGQQVVTFDSSGAFAQPSSLQSGQVKPL